LWATITDPAEFTYIWGALPWPGSVCGPAGGVPDRIKTKIDRFWGPTPFLFV
jgi:hypothetical protein